MQRRTVSSACAAAVAIPFLAVGLVVGEAVAVAAAAVMLARAVWVLIRAAVVFVAWAACGAVVAGTVGSGGGCAALTGATVTPAESVAEHRLTITVETPPPAATPAAVRCPAPGPVRSGPGATPGSSPPGGQPAPGSPAIDSIEPAAPARKPAGSPVAGGLVWPRQRLVAPERRVMPAAFVSVDAWGDGWDDEPPAAGGPAGVVVGPAVTVKIGGREVQGPPGTRVTLEETTRSSGRGAGMSSASGDLKSDMNAAAPAASIAGDGGGGGASASGGAVRLTMKLTGVKTSGAATVIAIGAVLLASGLVALFALRYIRLGAGLAAAGAVVLGVGFLAQEHAWVLELVGGLGILAAIGLALWECRDRVRLAAAGSHVVKAIDAVEQGAKREITAAADPEAAAAARDRLEAIDGIKSRVEEYAGSAELKVRAAITKLGKAAGVKV